MNRPTNKEMIDRCLRHYRDSPQSVTTRKSALNYFFGNTYFNYNGHVYDIKKSTLIDYFDYLNHHKDLAINTKKLKWVVLRSFLQFSMEYYDDFIVKIPQKTIKWKKRHKEPQSNADIVLTIDEVKKLLDYLKLNDYTFYLIFRTFAETGMRKGGIISIDYDKVNIESRYIDTYEKYGDRKCYYMSKDLAKYLDFYIAMRKNIKTNTKALFLSSRLKRFSNRYFNQYLKDVIKEVGIDKNVTCHTFRRTINTLRFHMGCDERKMCILLNHAINGVNFNSYVKFEKDSEDGHYKEFLGYYDKWNPYKEVQL